MTGIPDTRWLFTRGIESIRLVRRGDSTRCYLAVYGPGAGVETYEFENVAECMKRQAEIEQRLITAGYHVAISPPDRRNEHGSWQGIDQRRTAS
jgi:hypothetical protein